MRLFVAIELPERVRVAVEDLISRRRSGLPKARWVSGSSLHLTLVFLGDVPEPRLRPLGGALTEACGRQRPFRLQLEGSGCFPASGKARVAWVGVRGSAELVRLQASLAGALQSAIGFEPERRPYSPHLTVGRCEPPWPASAAKIWSEAVNGDLGEEFPVPTVGLIQSRLGAAGPTYTTLHRVPLGGKS